MLKLGYKASAEQFAPKPLLDFAVEAERLGFDSVFVSDHFQPWRHEGGHAPHSITWMAAVGARTSKIVIGTSVLTPTYRYHPSIVAQSFATLGCLFPGRIILGIGTGESLNEVPATGQPWPEFKERFARLRESVVLMRKLWSEEHVTFEGEYYKTVDATIYDRPTEPIPIYVAAGGPVVAKYVGRASAGFICTSGKGTELYKDKLIPAVKEGMELAKKPAGSVDHMIEMKVSFDTDLARAKEATRFWSALALSAEEKTSVHSPTEMARLADALPIDRIARRWIVSTDPDEHVEKIAPYVELGFNHLVFHAPGPDQVRFLQLYAKEVVPRLRKRFG
jgi:coenzyme F420-dependent glucose-6-phosphate dehydrogenase